MTVPSDIPPEKLIEHYVYDPSRVERIRTRPKPYPVEIVEYDLTWPQRYEEHRARIAAALGDQMVHIEHVGSTSVPGLPAKNVIDVDLRVRDIFNEDSYIPFLVNAGYSFLMREPGWHQHRYLVTERDDFYPISLHVWGDDQIEAVRHKIMKEWLTSHPDDRKLYAETKMQSAKESREAGETMIQYNLRKESVIREILERAFRSMGYM